MSNELPAGSVMYLPVEPVIESVAPMRNVSGPSLRIATYAVIAGGEYVVSVVMVDEVIHGMPETYAAELPKPPAKGYVITAVLQVKSCFGSSL
jgi:hypothetical protein